MFLMVLIRATQNRDAALEPKLDECSWPGPALRFAKIENCTMMRNQGRLYGKCNRTE
jgi:hypothetical protein